MKVSRTQKNCPLILYMLWELASSFPEKLVSFFFPSLLTGCLMNSPDLLLVPEPALEAVCRQRFGIRRAMAIVWWCHSAQVGGEATKQTQLCPHLAWAACLYPVSGTARVHQAVESLNGEMGFCGSERHPLGKSFSSKNAFSPHLCTHSALSNHLFSVTCLGRGIGRIKEQEKLIGVDAF